MLFETGPWVTIQTLLSCCSLFVASARWIQAPSPSICVPLPKKWHTIWHIGRLWVAGEGTHALGKPLLFLWWLRRHPRNQHYRPSTKSLRLNVSPFRLRRCYAGSRRSTLRDRRYSARKVCLCTSGWISGVSSSNSAGIGRSSFHMMPIGLGPRT